MSRLARDVRVKGWKGEGFQRERVVLVRSVFPVVSKNAFPCAHIPLMYPFYTLLPVANHQRCLRLLQRFVREQNMIGSALQRSFRRHLTIRHSLQKHNSSAKWDPKKWSLFFRVFSSFPLFSQIVGCDEPDGSRNTGGALTISNILNDS